MTRPCLESEHVAELEAENAKLRALNAHLIGRIAAAAEVLGAVAGRKPLCRCQIEAAQREAIAREPFEGDDT